MKRSLGYLLCGLVGVLTGYLIGREATPSAGQRAADVTLRGKATGSDAVRSKVSRVSDTILLGHITTVPFQELYGLLAQHPAAEIAAIAEQLPGLPEGRDKSDRITAFFKAWAHLGPTAAFASAVTFETVEARETAISATIAGADAAVAGSLAELINNLPAEALPATRKSGLLGMAIGRWAHVDAPAAAEFLNKSPAAGMGYDVAQNWAALCLVS